MPLAAERSRLLSPSPDRNRMLLFNQCRDGLLPSRGVSSPCKVYWTTNVYILQQKRLFVFTWRELCWECYRCYMMYTRRMSCKLRCWCVLSARAGSSTNPRAIADVSCGCSGEIYTSARLGVSDSEIMRQISSETSNCEIGFGSWVSQDVVNH